MTEGLVAGHYLHREKSHPKGRHVAAITADFAKGSSGGPVLDETGSVVAIVRSTLAVHYDRTNGRDTNVQMVWKHCIPATALLELLK